jgi:hypothetical protein
VVCLALNYRIIDEYYIGKNMKGTDHGIVEGDIPEGLRKTTKKSEDRRYLVRGLTAVTFRLISYVSKMCFNTLL